MPPSPTRDFQVFALTTADILRLRRLNALFADAFHQPKTSESEASDGYLGRLLADPHNIVLAALIGAEVVGGLVAYELRKFEREQSEIYIYDLAVAERFRRRGIASALLEQTCRLAAERGASAVFVQADYVDEPAIELYEGFGTRREVLHFDIGAQRIDPEPVSGGAPYGVKPKASKP